MFNELGAKYLPIVNLPFCCMMYLLQLFAMPLCVGPGGLTVPVGVGAVVVVVAVGAALTQ
jgi:hypothetical protein